MSSNETVAKNLKILVADDYSVTRDLIRSILKQLGFSNIEVAEDGKKAVQKLSESTFDLIICDWNMPGMTGLEVLRALRDDARTKDTPFLMLTAEAYRENVLEAMKAGVNDYIAKPFTAAILSEKIEGLFGGKKQA